MEGEPFLPLLPFPPLSWWAVYGQAKAPVIDLAEGYNKQTLRNRLVLVDSTGPFVLTLGLNHGFRREHPAFPMSKIKLSKHTPNQQHLKCIQTAYGKAPYFEHVMPELENLVAPASSSVAPTIGEWAMTSIQMMLSWAGRPHHAVLSTHESPMKTQEYLDWRRTNWQDAQQWFFPSYGQPFEDRLGFTPGLSGLDALFCLGPDWPSALASHQNPSSRPPTSNRF